MRARGLEPEGSDENQKTFFFGLKLSHTTTLRFLLWLFIFHIEVLQEASLMCKDRVYI